MTVKIRFPMTMMAASVRNNGGPETVGNEHPIHLEQATQTPFNEPKTNPNGLKLTKIPNPLSITPTRQYSLNRRHYATILFLLLYAFTQTMDTDANMSDASASAKRAASPLARRSQKKVVQEASPTKQTRFLEPPTAEDVVSTTANHNMATTGLEDLSELTLALARTPYERLFGHDSDDKLRSTTTSSPFSSTQENGSTTQRNSPKTNSRKSKRRRP
jgi:hypothetical protein